MRTLAQIILVRHDGALILRHTNDVPGITNSGYIGPFGRELQPNEIPYEAAHEAIQSQTNLQLVREKVVFWRRYPIIAKSGQHQGQSYFYLIHFVPSAELVIFDNEQPVILHGHADANRLNLPSNLRRAVTDLLHERNQLG